MSGTDLTGRCALVTGAARRTGRELALALARVGADIGVHYHSRRLAAESTAREIESLGRRAVCVSADLTDADAAQHAVDEVAARLGGLHILVNNVGVIVWKNIGALSTQEWTRCIDGTLNVTYHACRAALPHMRRAGWGRIVNILDADADALAPAPHATPYKIGKTGSLVLTKTLAVEEAKHGITVNAVSPGVLENSEKAVPLDRIPAGRAGTAADVAAAVLFFAGEDAGYVTGAHLKVSGGYLI